VYLYLVYGQIVYDYLAHPRIMPCFILHDYAGLEMWQQQKLLLVELRVVASLCVL
jgi:hypothetical protein